MASVATNLYPNVNNTCHSIYTCLHWRTKHLCSFPPTPQHVQMHTRKHAWNNGAAATAREADADAGGSALLLRSTQSTTLHLQSHHCDYTPCVVDGQKHRVNAEQPKNHSSPSHCRDRAPSKQHLLICTGAEPIHPNHGPLRLLATRAISQTRITFSSFSRAFCNLYCFSDL